MEDISPASCVIIVPFHNFVIFLSLAYFMASHTHFYTPMGILLSNCQFLVAFCVESELMYVI